MRMEGSIVVALPTYITNSPHFQSIETSRVLTSAQASLRHSGTWGEHHVSPPYLQGHRSIGRGSIRGEMSKF